MSDELALPPVTDMRTNEEIARAIWPLQLGDLDRFYDIRRAFQEMDDDARAEVEAGQISILMAALANIRGIGTA